MFTGIVQGMGAVTRADTQEGAMMLEIDLGSIGKDVERGASVSIAGACLTATAIDGTRVRFDVMGETLAKTSIGSLRVGDAVNVERSARIGDEIGGHLVSGHITETVTIRDVNTSSNNYIVTLECDPALMAYILPKGFVALDGCSLTIVDVSVDWFTVHLIPETLSRTTFGRKVIEDRVNLEIDSMTRAVVDTVMRLQK